MRWRHVVIGLLVACLAGCGPRLAKAPGWTQVTVGEGHACAIRGGKLYCWGTNMLGELGSALRHDHRSSGLYLPYRRYPTRVAGRGWSHVGAHEEATCGIRHGRLFCWGDGSDLSRLFGVDGDMFRHPRRVGKRSDWRTALPTDDGVCALQRDGALFCQGASGLDGLDTMNQLGLSVGWSMIDAGFLTNGGILRGRPWVWGEDARRREPRTSVAEIPGAGPWRGIALGDGYGCGIRRGELYCWGTNRYGELGDGTTTDRDEPIRVGKSAGWTDVAAGGSTTCGIDGGTLYCWGVAAWGKPRTIEEPSATTFFTTPQLADPRRDWSAIEVSNWIACGLRGGGRLACRTQPMFGIGVDGKPIDPTAAAPRPFVTPGTHKYEFLDL